MPVAMDNIVLYWFETELVARQKAPPLWTAPNVLVIPGDVPENTISFTHQSSYEMGIHIAEWYNEYSVDLPICTDDSGEYVKVIAHDYRHNE